MKEKRLATPQAEKGVDVYVTKSLNPPASVAE
jgi:hypothetical protein